MNGKYFWLKLKKDFFKRHDIRIIEAMPNGKDYILFYLKLLVESVDHEGELRFSDTIPYNAEMLAVITNTNVDVVKTALEVFSNLKMVEILDNQTIYMSEVEKMTGSAIDNENANRQRRFRERQKTNVLEASVTKNNAPVTDSVTENNESKSKSIELEKEIDNTIPPIIPRENSKLDEMFDEFWKSYPNRRKYNKKACRTKYGRIENIEQVHKDILNALEIHKKSKDWTKDNGEYIPAPLVYLNQERWKLTDTRTEREVVADQLLAQNINNYF